MKTIFVVLALVCLFIMTHSRLHHLQIAGGITEHSDFQNSITFRKIDTWIRSQKPELASATAVAYSSQVVAGAMYRITYETASKRYRVAVWSKPWEKFRKFTEFEV